MHKPTCISLKGDKRKWKKKPRRKAENVYTADITKAIIQKDCIALSVQNKAFVSNTRK